MNLCIITRYSNVSVAYEGRDGPEDEVVIGILFLVLKALGW